MLEFDIDEIGTAAAILKQAPPQSLIDDRCLPGIARKSLADTIQAYGRMIKFSHTIFALPFALAAVVLANRTHPVTLHQLFWILVAMVGARSAAMGFNRNAGFTSKDDRLPKMFYEEPLPPTNKVVVISDEQMDSTFDF